MPVKNKRKLQAYIGEELGIQLDSFKTVQNLNTSEALEQILRSYFLPVRSPDKVSIIETKPKNLVTCPKCNGLGEISNKVIDNGWCFACQGEGKVSRRSRSAYLQKKFGANWKQYDLPVVPKYPKRKSSPDQ